MVVTACTTCGCTTSDPALVAASLCRTCAQTETPTALKARALAAESECELLRTRLRHEGRIATSRILALADANARLVQWRHDYAEAMRANAELAAIVRAVAQSGRSGNAAAIGAARVWALANPEAP